MPLPGTRRLLKVLSGPHAGGEVLLSDGDFTIGSDDANEIVLSDDALSPRHARLTVRGDAVECRALEGSRIYLEGAGTDGAQLADFQCFTLGGTHLAVGPADAAWPAVKLPAPPVPVDDDASQSAADEKDQGAAGDAQSSPAAAAATRAASTMPPPAPVPAKRRGPLAAAAALAACCVALLAFLFSLANSGTAPAPAPVSRELQQAALEKAIANQHHDKSVKVVDQKTRFTVEGHVASPQERNELREALTPIDPTLKYRVFDTASLTAGVDGVLRMYKMNLTATAGDPGEVVVAGELTDPPKWTKVRQRIVADIPQLAKLTDHFANIAGPAPVANPDAKPLPPQTPTAAPQANLRVASATPTPAAAAPGLPPIQSINVGNTRSITLTSGERIFPGAVLSSGYTVKTIEADRVVLTRGASQHIIKIGS